MSIAGDHVIHGLRIGVGLLGIGIKTWVGFHSDVYILCSLTGDVDSSETPVDLIKYRCQVTNLQSRPWNPQMVVRLEPVVKHKIYIRLRQEKLGRYHESDPSIKYTTHWAYLMSTEQYMHHLIYLPTTVEEGTMM